MDHYHVAVVLRGQEQVLGGAEGHGGLGAGQADDARIVGVVRVIHAALALGGHAVAEPHALRGGRRVAPHVAEGEEPRRGAAIPLALHRATRRRRRRAIVRAPGQAALADPHGQRRPHGLEGPLLALKALQAALGRIPAGGGHQEHLPALGELGGAIPDGFDSEVHDRIVGAGGMVEVPPLLLEHLEALGLHGGPEQVPVGAGGGVTAGVGGVGALGHLVIAAGHGGRGTGGEVHQVQVHGAAPVVHGALGGIGHVVVVRGRRGVPEDLGDPPGAVAIVDAHPVARAPEGRVHPHQGLGHGALEEGPGLAVDRRVQEVVRGGVADVQLDRGVEGGDIHQVRRQAAGGHGRGHGLPRFGDQDAQGGNRRRLGLRALSLGGQGHREEQALEGGLQHGGRSDQKWWRRTRRFRAQVTS